MAENDMALAAGVTAAIEAIRPVLSGQGPEIQGAVLAELTSLWLAGHPDFVREKLLDLHIAAVRQLTIENEKLVHGAGGHPGNTGGPPPPSLFDEPAGEA